MNHLNQIKAKHTDIDQWINEVYPERDRCAPPFFLNKVMHRVAQEKKVNQIIHSPYYYRAIAAAILILVVVNLYTILKGIPESDWQTQTKNTKEQLNWLNTEDDSFSQYTKLALE
ncbi:MAG: hypothetical protein JXR39_10815 [Marinilabiliaceae bacterium]|nr:hypothetical protein [Marinilabiliaceae bacterium]